MSQQFSQYPQQQPYAKPPKKPKTALWVILGTTVGLMVGCAGGNAMGNAGNNSAGTSVVTVTAQPNGGNEPAATTTSSDQKSVRKVDLKATASPSGEANFYSDGSSNTEKFGTTWAKSIQLQKGKMISLTVSPGLDAYQKGGDMKMTCEIIVDGKSVDKKEGSGSSASAMCSYMGF